MKKEEFIIAGNWKMNKTMLETKKFIDLFIPMVKDSRCKIILFIPNLYLKESVKLLDKTNIKVGAQNFHWESFGAYTGEISIEMLNDIGVYHALVGHSERRVYFGETDEEINKKVKKAILKNIDVTLCVGESLEQRELGNEKEVIMHQLKNALNGISKESLSKINIAYEPIWAIGTGKTATPDQANQMCRFIRMCIQGMYDAESGINLKVLYGGSVNIDNCKDIIIMSDINGVLVGGASLDADKFSYIIKTSDKILIEGNK